MPNWSLLSILNGGKMPKLKTKSSAKKRFKVTGTGKIMAASAFKRHNLRKRPTKMKRQARGCFVLHDRDARIVRKYHPYI
jgi:large subunit ribosomal protein L35